MAVVSCVSISMLSVESDIMDQPFSLEPIKKNDGIPMYCQIDGIRLYIGLKCIGEIKNKTYHVFSGSFPKDELDIVNIGDMCV
eukprot:1604703-Ditylum_brightwellii.AAC.1